MAAIKAGAKVRRDRVKRIEKVREMSKISRRVSEKLRRDSYVSSARKSIPFR